MKEIKFFKVRYLYYISLVGLLVLYLFPGSLIGYFLYGNLAQQLDIIPNPIGTSINHAIAFFYLTTLGLITYLKEKNYSKTLFLLLSLSILLEISHFIIPNRSFQLLDLFANLLGTLLAIVIIFFYKRFKNGKI